MGYPGPGDIGELTGDLLDRWQATVSGLLDDGVRDALKEARGRSDEAWFFNAITDGAENAAFQDIDWIAFPRPLSQRYPDKRTAWRESDKTRRAQEEYCEWEVVRDQAEPTVIRKVIFTTETPDYYAFLFNNDQQLLLHLYHRYVSPEVELADLTLGGNYSQYNRWNLPETVGKTGTIMHMGGNGANTLGAAINLSAQATWPSVDGDGNPITAEQALIACRGFGVPERHSDPHIGAQVNQLVRLDKKVSFPGPVGLYIDDIDFSDFEIPGGAGPQDIFRIERGSDDYMMRIVFEAPAGSGFHLSDVKIGGEAVSFGGQLAEKMRIRVRGLAVDAANAAPKLPCDDAFRPVAPLAASRRPPRPV